MDTGFFLKTYNSVNLVQFKFIYPSELMTIFAVESRQKGLDHPSPEGLTFRVVD